MLLDPAGACDLTNGAQILNYLRSLMRQFQTSAYQEPSSLYSPARSPLLLDDHWDPIDRHQYFGTARLTRCLNLLRDHGIHSPHPEYAPNQPRRTVLDGDELVQVPPNRWASTHFRFHMVMASYGLTTSPLNYMHCLLLNAHSRSLHDALRPNNFDPTDYLSEFDCPPCDHRPGWKNTYWVIPTRYWPDNLPATKATHYRLCRAPGCSRICQPRDDDPHAESFESISCSTECMSKIIKY